MKHDNYVNPNHYKRSCKETWEMMVDIWGKEKYIAFCEMNAFKYRMRAGLKPDQPLERELEKAKWYELKAMELKNESNDIQGRVPKGQASPHKHGNRLKENPAGDFCAND